MKREKKIWLIEQYAQKVWTISLALTQEAARAGEHGRDYAIVAHEARMFADRMFTYAGNVRFDGIEDDSLNGVAEFALQVKLLSLNAEFTAINMADINMDYNIPKSMAVFAAELERVAYELNELTNKRLWEKPSVIPEISSPKESGDCNEYFLFSISGFPLIECIKNINATHCYQKSDVERGALSIRGTKIPLLNCYSFFNLPNSSHHLELQTVLIVNPKISEGTDKQYAVLIDDLSSGIIFQSKRGTPVSPKQCHAFKEFSRECWDLIGGEQVILTDWDKILKKFTGDTPLKINSKQV